MDPPGSIARIPRCKSARYLDPVLLGGGVFVGEGAAAAAPVSPCEPNDPRFGFLFFLFPNGMLQRPPPIQVDLFPRRQVLTARAAARLANLRRIEIIQDFASCSAYRLGTILAPDHTRRIREFSRIPPQGPAGRSLRSWEVSPAASEIKHGGPTFGGGGDNI